MADSNETFAADVDRVLKEIGDMLKAKNAAYGNSALDPVRIFSKAETVEQLNVRIDDKLSRIQRGHAAGEDVEDDLTGYLLLKRIARDRASADASGAILSASVTHEGPIKVASNQFERVTNRAVR